MPAGLFSASHLAATESLPSAPILQPHHEWSFPGMSPEDSGRKGWAISSEYADLLAAVVKSQGGDELTDKQVMALVPDDWKALLGPFVHGGLTHRQGEQRGILVKFTSHEGGGGFHFSYRAQDAN